MIKDDLKLSLIEETDEAICWATNFELNKEGTKILKDFPPKLGIVKKLMKPRTYSYPQRKYYGGTEELVFFQVSDNILLSTDFSKNKRVYVNIQKLTLFRFSDKEAAFEFYQNLKNEAKKGLDKKIQEIEAFKNSF